MLTFTYCSKGQGEAYVLNYKTNAGGFASIANLSLVSSRGTISHCHITLTSLLPLLSNTVSSLKIQHILKSIIFVSPNFGL